MTTLAIILALAAERFLLEQENYRRYSWFSGYREWIQEQSWGPSVSEGSVGVIALLLPPLLIVGLLQALLEGMLGGTLELLFGIAILLYSLGPRDLDRQITEFIDHWDSGDEENAKAVVSDLLPPETSQDGYGTRLARAIMEHACYRIFGVLFWFILLGPIGALLYRLSQQLHTISTEQDNNDPEFSNDLNRLLEILNWLPARATAITFAIAGNFQEAIVGWRGSEEMESEDAPAKSAGEILADTGLGAVGLKSFADEEEQEEYVPSHAAEVALALVWRTIAAWAGLLILSSISGWLG
jgi:membrane protein required for beta-lactamase induction